MTNQDNKGSRGPETQAEGADPDIGQIEPIWRQDEGGCRGHSALNTKVHFIRVPWGNEQKAVFKPKVTWGMFLLWHRENKSDILTPPN